MESVGLMIRRTYRTSDQRHDPAITDELHSIYIFSMVPSIYHHFRTKKSLAVGGFDSWVHELKKCYIQKKFYWVKRALYNYLFVAVIKNYKWVEFKITVPILNHSKTVVSHPNNDSNRVCRLNLRFLFVFFLGPKKWRSSRDTHLLKQ